MHRQSGKLEAIQLQSEEDPFKQVGAAFERAVKFIHEQGKFSSKDLSNKAVKPLIKETFKVLNEAVETGISTEIPHRMLKKMKTDVFVFSGMKTYAQLKEASTLLFDEKGNIKSAAAFIHDVQKVNSTYNVNYLRAEHQYAISASESASRWHDFQESGDKYLLQLRTANDDRVRDSHAILHNITLPKSSPFWDRYFPPLDWGCRCLVIEVLKGKYEVSRLEDVEKIGEKATPEMFRYNPGKQGIIFPPNHPYHKLSKQAKEVVQEIAKADEDLAKEALPQFAPKNILDYEDKTGVKINRDFFDYLNKTVSLDISKKSGGAYYNPNKKEVVIPISKRVTASKWKAEAIVYHEFGHAIDWQHGYRENDSVKKLMDKYRKEFAKEKNKMYRQIETKINNLYLGDISDVDREKVLAAADTLMSLNKVFGFGHTQAYFKRPGMKEAEFIAHAFENAFVGNDQFKELMPELYDDMIQLIKDLKPK